MYGAMDSCVMNQQPNKYVMSLDSLDLSLLSSTFYSRQKNKNPLLWSLNLNKRNSHDEDYCQFEIKPKVEATTNTTTSEIDSIDCVSSQETTICYICNTEIPLLYIIDHEESLKHKAFAKITEVVLNRVRKHMLKREIIKNVQSSDSMYFCASCVLVVCVKDRKSHEKSNAHKRSVSFDRLLHELVAIYTEEDTDNEPSLSVSGSPDPGCIDSTVDANSSCVKAEANNDFESNTVVISDIKASSHKHENEIKKERANEHVDTQMEYIKLLDQYDTEKLNTLSPENGNIRIETQDGFEVIVPEDNFHGFIRIGKRHIQCKICKVIIKDEQEHKTSEDHIRRIVKPFADKHCVRDLDNSWSHCVICNAIIDNSGVHALCNKAHERQLQKALVSDKNQCTKKLNSVFYCSTCNISIHINDIDTHKNGYRHINLLNATAERDPNFVNSNGSNDAEPAKDVNKAIIQTHKEITNNLEHFCATCNIIINVNNLDSHINGKKHALNSKSPLHYVMKLVDETQELICRVCSVYIIDNPVQVKSHVDTVEHQSKLKEFLEANRVTEHVDWFYCKPCHVSIRKMNEFYHIEKYSHEMKLIAFKEQEERQVVNENFILCHICEILIPNDPYSIEKHNNGDRHKNNIAEVAQEMAELTKANTIPTPQTTAKLHHEMSDTVNPKELKCKICQVFLPNKQEAIDEHLKGTKHKSSLRAIMEDNLIELRNEKYYCNPCKIVVAAEKEFMHTQQPKHKKKLMTYKSNNNQTSEEQINARENEANEAPKSNTATKAVQNNSSATAAKEVNNETVDLYSLLKHHFKDTDTCDLECRVCNVSMIRNTPIDAFSHAREIEHKITYNKIMMEHLMFESDTMEFYCGICQCLVPGKGELTHLFSPKHIKKRANITQNEGFCANCHIPTVGIDMEEHITSSRHINRLKQTQCFFHYCEDCGTLLKKNSQTIDYHKQNCLLFRTHNLAVKDKICYCILCNLYFTKNLINDHVSSNEHMRSFGLIHS